MIQHPAEHFFEAKFPELEDHEMELWYQHPVHPFRCNQLGIFDFGDVEFQYNRLRDTFVLYKNNMAIGSRSKLAYECYHNTILLNNRMYYVDGNPLNNSFLNILTNPTEEERKELHNTQQVFFIKTIEYMAKKSEKLRAKGIDPDDYWNLISLPKSISKRWDDFKKGKKQKSYTVKGGYATNEVKENLKRVIMDLHAQGMETKHIAKELNMTRQYICQFRRRNGI